jgi:hypothetical protein
MFRWNNLHQFTTFTTADVRRIDTDWTSWTSDRETLSGIKHRYGFAAEIHGQQEFTTTLFSICWKPINGASEEPKPTWNHKINVKGHRGKGLILWIIIKTYCLRVIPTNWHSIGTLSVMNSIFTTAVTVALKRMSYQYNVRPSCPIAPFAAEYDRNSCPH